jgi:hypothetical protein
MHTGFTIFRYGLLLGGAALILPHLLQRYAITDLAIIDALHFAQGWLIGLILCALGFGWPEKQKSNYRRGDGIGWTSHHDGSGDGGGD